MPVPTSEYPSTSRQPSLDSIKNAHARIKPYIHCTPLQTSRTLSDYASKAVEGVRTACGRPVRIEVALKCENLQRIGAFKIRGATNAVLQHLSTLPPTSPGEVSPVLTIFTHSSGNHAQAMALAAVLLSSPERPIRATIIMPVTASPVKRNAVLGYGARVVDCPSDTTQRQIVCDAEIAKVRDAGDQVLFIPPYDHIDVIEGQGTCVLEVANQIQNVWGPVGSIPDIVMAPIGGGGLMSGTSVASKGLWKDVVVVGAEPEAANDAHESFYSKTWHPAKKPSTICDGLLTATGPHTLPIILANVDEVLVANDDATIRAMKLVWERMKLIIEPSSALALATILSSTLGGSPLPSTDSTWAKVVREAAERRALASEDQGTPVVVRAVVIISGGNVDLAAMNELFASVAVSRNHS